MQDPHTETYSPEQLRKSSERPAEELDPRWDTIAEDAPAFVGEDGEVTTEISDYYKPNDPSAWDSLENFDATAQQEEPYEKVEQAPVYGVDASGDEFNNRMNEYLTKGFWTKGGEATPEAREDSRDALETEGGAVKNQNIIGANLSTEQAVSVFELSKRADFGTDELAEVCKGMPDLEGMISELVNNSKETVAESENLEETIMRLDEKYNTSLKSIEDVREKLVGLNVPVELSGAILSKLSDLETQLRAASETISNIKPAVEEVSETVTAIPQNEQLNPEIAEIKQSVETDSNNVAEVADQLAA
ncbi:MAG: hypothetical protein Q4E47_00075 [Candidatus Saccharibacteria bacterium]|nr:hypothetical protein [Candidatus Saccharibacteria bacterium]